MTGLTIILASSEPERARAALTLAISHAALGGRARLFAHERAVAMLAPSTGDPDAEALAAAGLPDRIRLLRMAHDEGVMLIACQTGLALTSIALPDLAPGCEAGGMMSLLATLGEDRLVTL